MAAVFILTHLRQQIRRKGAKNIHCSKNLQLIDTFLQSLINR